MSIMETQLFQIASENRGRELDLLTFLRAVKTHDLPIDYETIQFFIRRFANRRIEGLPHPLFIVSFIISYLEGRTINSIFDPYAATGSLIVPLMRHFKPEKAVGYIRSSSDFEIATELIDSAGVEWRPGSPSVLLEPEQGQYDVVVSHLPWNWDSPKEEIFHHHELNIEIRDYLDRLILLKSSKLLAPEGVGLFIVPNSFTMGDRNRSVYRNLYQFGLYVDAILSLPAGTFQPTTAAPGLLVFIRRQEPTQLFVGELTDDLQAQEVLLSNLKHRREGSVPHLGTLVDSNTYRSFAALVAEREIEGYVLKTGSVAVRLSEIAYDLKRGRSSEEPFSDTANSIYVPLVGYGPVVTTPENLAIKPYYAAQVVIDPSRALASHVANFLNSPFGQTIRVALGTSTSQPRISLEQLKNTTLYLPPLPIQQHTVELETRITRMTTQLEDMRRQLWETPNTIEEIGNSLDSFGLEDNFEQWIEKLPYPIASILWKYLSAQEAEEQAKHLHNFFEVFAAFISIILLSGFATDKAVYGNRLHELVSINRNKWWDKPSFGNWRSLAKKLSEEANRELTTKQNSPLLDIFGTTSQKFIASLADKRLHETLNEANNYRNLWKGHGGLTSEEEHQNRLTSLQQCLERVRQVIHNGFADVMLIIPEVSKYSDGIYRYTVKHVIGTRAPFKRSQLSTLTVMDEKRLYLLRKGELKPIEILPLLCVNQVPDAEQYACYLYSGVENGKFRWETYHFEGKFLPHCPDNRVTELLKRFSTPNKS